MTCARSWSTSRRTAETPGFVQWMSSSHASRRSRDLLDGRNAGALLSHPLCAPGRTQHNSVRKAHTASSGRREKTSTSPYGRRNVSAVQAPAGAGQSSLRSSRFESGLVPLRCVWRTGSQPTNVYPSHRRMSPFRFSPVTIRIKLPIRTAEKLPGLKAVVGVKITFLRLPRS